MIFGVQVAFGFGFLDFSPPAAGRDLGVNSCQANVYGVFSILGAVTNENLSRGEMWVSANVCKGWHGITERANLPVPSEPGPPACNRGSLLFEFLSFDLVRPEKGGDFKRSECIEGSRGGWRWEASNSRKLQGNKIIIIKNKY